MDGRENTCVDYVFGLARNARLVDTIRAELGQAQAASLASGKAERVFKDFMWTTLKSWPCERRVIARAEWTGRGQSALCGDLPETQGTRRKGLFTRTSIARAQRWRTGSRPGT